MPDVNSVIIAGNLTRDPAFRKTTNGTPVTNFWIASNRRFKDNTGNWRENVCYVGVVAWYKLAENCAEKLHKGCPVIIEGELQSRSLRGDDGRNRNIVEVKARRVQFLNKKGDALEATTDDDTAENQGKSSSRSGEDESEKKVPDLPAEVPDAENPMKGKFDFGYKNLKL
jgi:single-strand DNA-binding protein